MEEERIKSALEIAMERISALPELTPEEITAQKEKQYSPVGEAISGRYMNGLIGDYEIIGEMDKYKAEQKQIIRRALVSSLCRAMRIGGDSESAARALKGIGRVMPGKELLIKEAAENFHSIMDEFEKEKQMRSVEFRASSVQKMKEFGISGTAVKPNLNDDESWQNELGRMSQAYESKLSALRGRLLQAVGVS